MSIPISQFIPLPTPLFPLLSIRLFSTSVSPPGASDGLLNFELYRCREHCDLCKGSWALARTPVKEGAERGFGFPGNYPAQAALILINPSLLE